MLTGTGRAVQQARDLRKTMSLPETILWRELRQRPGGYKFRRQHPAGRFVVDFACLGARLLIEIDGQAHDGATARDADRDRWLEEQGYRVLRITARDVLSNLEGVVRLIVGSCGSETPLHQPSAGPPPRSGEDLLRAAPPRNGEGGVAASSGMPGACRSSGAGLRSKPWAKHGGGVSPRVPPPA